MKLDYIFSIEEPGHLHQTVMDCGETQLMMEILHIANDSGKLGAAAQKLCNAYWHEVSQALKVRHK